MDLNNFGVSISTAGLAQLVERKTLNLVVVGSSPTVGVLLTIFLPQFVLLSLRLHSSRTKYPTDQLLWRSWQRVGLIIPRSPVRPRSKAFCFWSHPCREVKPKWWFRWDSNPRPQDGLELESSALDHSATKPCVHV